MLCGRSALFLPLWPAARLSIAVALCRNCRCVDRIHKRVGQTPVAPTCLFPVEIWLRGRDLNPRPLGYEPNELPDCSTPRQLEDLTVYHSEASRISHVVSLHVLIRHTRTAPRGARRAVLAANPSIDRPKRLGTTLANIEDVTVLGGLILVTSSVAVSLGLSRLALGEFFRLVRIDTTDRTISRPQDAARR